MIEIENIRIEDQNDKSKLCADIRYNGNITTLWYEVDKEYKKFLCTERADAFLVALLLFAMEKNENINIIDVPITSKLYFNITHYIIPIFSRENKYKKIIINTSLDDKELDNENANGTGISLGVDSFTTLKEYTEKCPENLKINWLTFFNVGSHKENGGEEGRNLFLKRKKISRRFAEKNNFKFIAVDSNISEFLRQKFIQTHTFRSVSAVLAIQKLFKNYYYSSGFSLYDFKVNILQPAQFDVYILNFLSNGNVSFYSTGCTYINRLNKVEYIKDYKLAQENLSVCFMDEVNCGKCEKCVRTLFELYIIGSLENFKKVFNVKEFYENKEWYDYIFMRNYYKQKSDYIDMYKLMKSKKIKINLKSRIKAFIRIKIIGKLIK